MADLTLSLRTCLERGNYRLAERALQANGDVLPQDLYAPVGMERFLEVSAGWMPSHRVLSLHPWLEEHGYPVDEPAYQRNRLQALVRHSDEKVAHQAVTSPHWPAVDHPDAQMVLRASLHGPSDRLAWVMHHARWTGAQVTQALAECDPVIELINLDRCHQPTHPGWQDLCRHVEDLYALGITSSLHTKAHGIALAHLLESTADMPEEAAFVRLWQGLITQGHNAEAVDERGLTRHQAARQRYPDLFRIQERQDQLAQRPATIRRPRLRS